MFLLLKVKSGSNRAEWKEKTEIKQASRIKLQEQSPPWIHQRPIGPQSSVLWWWVHTQQSTLLPFKLILSDDLHILDKERQVFQKLVSVRDKEKVEQGF